RVVAEAAGSARLAEYETGAGAKRGEAATVRQMQHGGAGVVGGAAVLGRIAERFEEGGVVGVVQFGPLEAGCGGEATGADARSAVQPVDADAGVVGDRGATGDAEKVRRFRVGILEERLEAFDVLFGRVFRDVLIVERSELDGRCGRDDVADLASLVAAAGGEDHDGAQGSAFSGRAPVAGGRTVGGCRPGRGSAAAGARPG